MEKQSLIKYYCALFLGVVLLAGCNSTASAATTSSQNSITDKNTIISLAPPVNAAQNSSSVDTMLPLILSILALAASGGAIALTILKNKKINERIESDNEKYNNKLKSLETDNIKPLEKNFNDLLTSQSNQPLEAISPSSTTYSNTNVYLESDIQRLSERITELENKLKATPSNQQSIISSNSTYLANQSRNLEPDLNPFSQTANFSQPDINQPVENIAYVELVNIYRDNPKLLEQKAIKVSEDKDSIARRHTDSSQKIVLEKANNSNYWVIHDDGCIDCWLLPKSKLRIDQFRYETTKALFECNGYQPEYSTFKLVKPAKVIPLSADEQTWQLEEPGILEFTL